MSSGGDDIHQARSRSRNIPRVGCRNSGTAPGMPVARSTQRDDPMKFSALALDYDGTIARRRRARSGSPRGDRGGSAARHRRDPRHRASALGSATRRRRSDLLRRGRRRKRRRARLSGERTPRRPQPPAESRVPAGTETARRAVHDGRDGRGDGREPCGRRARCAAATRTAADSRVQSRPADGVAAGRWQVDGAASGAARPARVDPQHGGDRRRGKRPRSARCL